MIWLLLLVSFLFPRSVLAAGSLTITNTPGTIITGDIFPVSYLAVGLTAGDVYAVKAYGGTGSVSNQINTYCTSLPCPQEWNSTYPQIIIDAGGSAVGTVSAIITNISGQANLRLRLAKSPDFIVDSYITADPKVITIATPSPTPTVSPLPTNSPTPTPNPSSTPVPSNTSTPTPTNTPAPTSTPSPTIIPTATPVIDYNPTPINDPLPTDDPNSQILGTTDNPSPLLTPTVKTKTISANLIPTIFIILGGLLLIIPLVVSKIKFKPRWPRS